MLTHPALHTISENLWTPGFKNNFKNYNAKQETTAARTTGKTFLKVFKREVVRLLFSWVRFVSECGNWGSFVLRVRLGL